MTEFPRPRVVVSRCIGFDHCRYNGQMISSDFVNALRPFVDFLPVCPEMEIGLGVPRGSIRLIYVDKSLRLVQPSTGRDMTEPMTCFSDTFLQSLGDVDGFILKFRSPSCGLKEVKVYSGPGRSDAIKKTAGLFGKAVVEFFPGLPVEDEGRLRNLAIRSHFLTRLFTLAGFHALSKNGPTSDLIRFHADNMLLLGAHSQIETRHLGEIAANHQEMDKLSLMDTYWDHLLRALSRPPTVSGNIGVMMRAMGYFSDQLSIKEQKFFREMLQRYRDKRVPIAAPMSVLRGWVTRFDDPYLGRQTFFSPYPEELLEVCGTGSQPDSRKP